MTVVAKVITETFKCVELPALGKYAGFKVYDFGQNLVEAKDFEDEAKRQGKIVWFTYCNQAGEYKNSHDDILLKADFSNVDIDAVMGYFCENCSRASFIADIEGLITFLLGKTNQIELGMLIRREGIESLFEAINYTGSKEQYVVDLISEILTIESNSSTISDFDDVLSFEEKANPVESKINDIQADLVTQINGEVNIILDLTTRKELNNAVKKQVSQTVKSIQQSAISQTQITNTEKTLISQARQHQVEEESQVLTDLGFSIDGLRSGNVSQQDLDKLTDIIKVLQNVRDILVAEQKINQNQATKQVKGVEVLIPAVKKILSPIRKKALDSISKASKTVSKCFSKLLNYKENSKRFNIETDITADKVQACRWIKLNLENIFKFDVSTVDSIHNYGTKTSKISQQDFANSLSLLASL